MGYAALDQRFALDVQGVDALRRTVRAAPQEGLRQVSRQFEALFMHMVIKSMRASVPQGGGLFDSQSQRLYTELLDQQWAQSLSGRGVGLADAMLGQLQRQFGPGAALPREGGTGRAALRAYRANAGTGQAPAAMDTASPGNHVDRFVGRMGASALRASAATGVPAPLILAQAALESGWGRREIVGDDGVRSHNLFGIKAGKGWHGASVEVWTTEYVDGAPQRVRARFRAYGS